MYGKALCAMALCVAAGGATAQTAPAAHGGFYVGAFGGGGQSLSSTLRQRGAVHVNPRFSLPIHAQGPTGRTSVAVGGIQAGYAWQGWSLGQGGWQLRPAVELEGLYIGKHTPLGVMPVRPRALGTQYVSIPMTARVLLTNVVFDIKTPYSDAVVPYLGAGVGRAFLSIKGSDSDNPMEPGINHFNSDPDASDSAFAAQFKAGLRAAVGKHVHVFAEYRYLFIDDTRYTFGATDYPGLHLPTAPWRVDLGRQKYNLFVAGLQYRF